MLLDHNSLFAAFSLSALGLAAVFFVSWLVSRSERFLIAWTIGVSLMALGVSGYGWYTRTLSPAIGALGYGVLLTGLAFVYGAGREFRSGELPWRVMTAMAVICSGAVAAPMLTGQNGLSIIIFNLAAATILFVTAWDYWQGRSEARIAITSLSALYLLTGLSFVPCAVLLLLEGHWTLAAAPVNWAEDLNIVVCLTTLAGIGSLSLALNQSRLARGHKRDAETDPLTGLLNRRALLRRIAEDASGPAALVVFDIDRFKAVNDRHGHLAGDEVLRGFGEILLASAPADGLCARLGGEEFAMLLPRLSLVSAAILADDIRLRLARRSFAAVPAPFSCSVSAGVAQADEPAVDFGLLLRQADEALYAAKDNGRDQVAVSSDDALFKAQMHASAGGQRGPVDLVRLKAG